MDNILKTYEVTFEAEVLKSGETQWRNVGGNMIIKAIDKDDAIKKFNKRIFRGDGALSYTLTKINIEEEIPMKQQIHLNEETLKGMIREAISEYVGEAYGDIRPNTQMMLDYIDDGLVDPKKVLTELLDYVSDDIVGRFMENNGYSLEDDEEELDNDTDNEELPAGVTPLDEGRFGSVYDNHDFDGSQINGKNGILQDEKGQNINVSGIRFIGDSIICTGGSGEKIHLFISGGFAKPLNGSNIPFASRNINGIQIKNLSDTNGTSYILNVLDDSVINEAINKAIKKIIG